ncbi:hypothetical protein D030_2045B, partial [Vibrio parahaemolyticus AQ3810]
ELGIDQLGWYQSHGSNTPRQTSCSPQHSCVTCLCRLCINPYLS